MSILKAMNIGLTGLNVQGRAMSLIGDNIANVNTVGFKGSRVNFQEVLDATLFGAPQTVGGQLIMINNQLPEMPLGVDGPTAEKEVWILVNNRFAGQAEAQWNRLMTLLQADGHKVAAHVLAAQDSDPSPVSGLLFSGGGW